MKSAYDCDVIEDKVLGAGSFVPVETMEGDVWFGAGEGCDSYLEITQLEQTNHLPATIHECILSKITAESIDLKPKTKARSLQP
ncbi:hypothetical protein E4U36_000522 [Claviceps purpurea]|nr:hypothetical protein E4U36_000522 [Claviceps purpurea]